MDFYCIEYGPNGEDAVLWSEAGGFEPIALPSLRGLRQIGGRVAVIPDRVVVARARGGLVVMDWSGSWLEAEHWPLVFDVEAVFPVLDDTAILIAYEDRDELPAMRGGAAMWRPGEPLHRVTGASDGGVQGPSNAYFGFHHDRDLVLRLDWPESASPSTSRVLNVPGWKRTAAAMSPDGRYVVSGGFGFKVLRTNPIVYEANDARTRLGCRVGEPEQHQALDPVWLRPTFGAPSTIEAVRPPDWIWSRDR